MAVVFLVYFITYLIHGLLFLIVQLGIILELVNSNEARVGAIPLLINNFKRCQFICTQTVDAPEGGHLGGGAIVSLSLACWEQSFFKLFCFRLFSLLGKEAKLEWNCVKAADELLNRKRKHEAIQELCNCAVLRIVGVFWHFSILILEKVAMSFESVVRVRNLCKNIDHDCLSWKNYIDDQDTNLKDEIHSLLGCLHLCEVEHMVFRVQRKLLGVGQHLFEATASYVHH